ncbi:MAG: P-loop NTPase family protein [Trichodesmium sp.]
MVAQLQTPSLNVPSNLPYTVPGLVQVFTSKYRNFFTDVMAQALRIAGQGTPVLIVQFLKGGINQGHEQPVQLGQNLDWVRCGFPGCIDTSDIDEAHKNSLLDLWQYTQEVINQEKYSLVVLDELSLAVDFGLIPENEVLDFLDKRPSHIDVILTGPNIPEEILEMADQITEIRRSHRP